MVRLSWNRDCCSSLGPVFTYHSLPQVRFEFHSVALELVESFWTFQIPNLNLSVAFLLVGTAREPMVYIDQAHLNMGSLLIGGSPVLPPCLTAYETWIHWIILLVSLIFSIKT